jgi:hypothetical protein
LRFEEFEKSINKDLTKSSAHLSVGKSRRIFGAKGAKFHRKGSKEILSPHRSRFCLSRLKKIYGQNKISNSLIFFG